MTSHSIPSRPPLIADWLMQPMREARGLFGQVALAAVLINLFALVTSLFSMTVYNRILPANAVDSLVALTVGVVIVMVFDFVLRSLRGYFVDVAGAQIDQKVGASLFDQLLRLRLADRKGSTGTFAGLFREFETLRDFFASATIVAIVDVPFVLLFLVSVWAIGGWLVAVPLLMVPLVIGSALASKPALDRLSADAMGQGLTKQGVLVETVSGLETIKSTAAGPLLRARWQDAVEHHADLSLRQRLVAAFSVNVAQSAQNICYIGTVILGVHLVASQQLTMGGLVAASILAGRCVAPLGQIAQILTRLSHTMTAYRQLDGIMQARTDSTAALRRRELGGSIEFDRVRFRYPGAGADALDDVSFRIEPGERVAILGRVGSGKSTITRLIAGLYHPDEGQVLIDGSDVRQLHVDDLQANVGAVLQDVFLLSGSVKDNITLGRDLDDEAVLRAARLSGTHEFVGQIAQGYELKLADRGEGLSGGQRQSIAIARAIASPKPILLLDEPTSAMDTQSENALIGRLEAELAGRTVVLVTHRQSMLRLATRIIIVDRGRIVAQGPRDDVLRSLAVGAQ